MTETTQPDPQVVACPRCMAPPGAACRTSGVGLTRRHHESRELAARRATREPLTVADIPAGQGPASLFLVPDGDDYDLRFKYADGRTGRADLELGTLSNIFIAAVRDHLAATLPHVTTEEGA